VYQALLAYAFIFKVVTMFCCLFQDFVNLKGEVFFPNLTFEMEKVRDKISSDTRISSILLIKDLNFLCVLTLNL